MYRESFDETILQNKAARMRKESNDESFHSRFDQRGSKTITTVNALVRPLEMFAALIFTILVSSICLLSLYVYLLASTITEVFQTNYGFSEGEAGLTFLGLATGMALVQSFAPQF